MWRCKFTFTIHSLDLHDFAEFEKILERLMIDLYKSDDNQVFRYSYDQFEIALVDDVEENNG